MARLAPLENGGKLPELRPNACRAWDCRGEIKHFGQLRIYWRCGCDILFEFISHGHDHSIYLANFAILVRQEISDRKSSRFQIPRAIKCWSMQPSSQMLECCDILWWNGEAVRMHQNTLWRRQGMSFYGCGLRYCDFIAKPGVKCPRCLAQSCLYIWFKVWSIKILKRIGPTRHALIFKVTNKN